ncbi:MAG: hypothetical protein COA47_11345 [Robiginitomaculum sp.]|nr:MAG: hypothetical protein COA47_11345 [Robiginitomaculum sp.]
MQNAGTTSFAGSMQNTGDAARGWDRVASLSVFDLIGLLWRQLPIMLIVFIAIFSIGLMGAMSLKKEYTAQGRILVQYGEEYIYNPVIGSAGQGTAYTTDQMIQAEVGFFTAAILKERVLEKLGLRQIFPKLAIEFDNRASSQAQATGKAVRDMNKNLGAYTAPNQPLISVSYKNSNPEVSALVLNAIIDEYMVYRREILLDSSTERYGNERKTTEVKLTEVNTELALFLNANSIGDFEAERVAAGVRYAALSDQLLAAKARSREIDAGIRAREDRLVTIPKEILQYTDDSSSGELAALQIEREQLLARYKPASKPVQAIDASISRLRKFIADGKNKDLGVRRTGVNLVHQTLQSEKLSLESEAQSNAERISVLGAQISQVRAKQSKMQKLFPQYQRLAGKVEVLQVAVRQFSTREEELKARHNLAEEASNNIRVIERPVVPFEGKSMKKAAAVLAFLFAGFTALMVGLGIVFSKIAKSAALAKPVPVGAYPAVEGRPIHPGGGARRTAARSMAQPSAAPHTVPPHVAAANMANAAYEAAVAPQPQPDPYGYYSSPAAANRPPAMAVPPIPRPVQQPTNPFVQGFAPGGLPVLANIGPQTRSDQLKNF